MGADCGGADCVEGGDGVRRAARQLLAVYVLDLGYSDVPWNNAPFRHYAAWEILKEEIGEDEMKAEIESIIDRNDGPRLSCGHPAPAKVIIGDAAWCRMCDKELLDG